MTHHMFIWKPNDPNSLAFKKQSSMIIVIILHVMRLSIQFNTKSQIGAIKIQYIWANSLLAAEF